MNFSLVESSLWPQNTSIVKIFRSPNRIIQASLAPVPSPLFPCFRPLLPLRGLLACPPNTSVAFQFSPPIIHTTTEHRIILQSWIVSLLTSKSLSPLKDAYTLEAPVYLPQPRWRDISVPSPYYTFWEIAKIKCEFSDLTFWIHNCFTKKDVTSGCVCYACKNIQKERKISSMFFSLTECTYLKQDWAHRWCLINIYCRIKYGQGWLCGRDYWMAGAMGGCMQTYR